MANNAQLDARLTKLLSVVLSRVTEEAAAALSGTATVHTEPLPKDRSEILELTDLDDIVTGITEAITSSNSVPELILRQHEAIILSALRKTLLVRLRTYPEIAADSLTRLTALAGPAGPLQGQANTALMRPLGAAEEANVD